jgi:hypothetical protein
LVLLFAFCFFALRAREIDDDLLWRPEEIEETDADRAGSVVDLLGTRELTMEHGARSTSTEYSKKTRGTVGTVSLRCKGHFENLSRSHST